MYPTFGELIHRADLRQTLGPERTLKIPLFSVLFHCVFTPDFLQVGHKVLTHRYYYFLMDGNV